jgi:hypothetical protein
LIVVSLGAAIGRVVLCPGPRALDGAAPPAARAMFLKVASEEGALRAKTARKFPGDPWSADDDFHHAEQSSARAIADTQRVDLAQVLAAIDQGLRGHWSFGEGVAPLATVPVCHPRPE